MKQQQLPREQKHGEGKSDFLLLEEDRDFFLLKAPATLLSVPVQKISWFSFFWLPGDNRQWWSQPTATVLWDRTLQVRFELKILSHS